MISELLMFQTVSRNDGSDNITLEGVILTVRLSGEVGYRKLALKTALKLILQKGRL